MVQYINRQSSIKVHIFSGHNGVGVCQRNAYMTSPSSGYRAKSLAKTIAPSSSRPLLLFIGKDFFCDLFSLIGYSKGTGFFILQSNASLRFCGSCRAFAIILCGTRPFYFLPLTCLIILLAAHALSSQLLVVLTVLL